MWRVSPFSETRLHTRTQNVRRNASCINRGWFDCVVTRPRLDCAAVVTCVLGIPNWVRLNRLNASARSVRFTRPLDWRRLRHGEVPVVHVVSPQIGVHTRRVAELPSRLWIRGHCGIRHGEARGVEPSIQPIDADPLDALIAVRIDIRPQAIARPNQVRRGGEGERKSALDRRHAIQAPPADQLASDPRRAGTEPASLAEREVDNEVERPRGAEHRSCSAPTLPRDCWSGSRRPAHSTHPRANSSASPRRSCSSSTCNGRSRGAGTEALLGPERQRVVAARARSNPGGMRTHSGGTARAAAVAGRSAWTTRLHGSPRRTDSSPAAGDRRRSRYPAGPTTKPG